MDGNKFGGFGQQPGSTWAGGGIPGNGLFGFNPFGHAAGAAFDDERQNRKIRIEPYLKSIKEGRIPNLPKEQLQSLMKDLKEEGNALFKDKNYHQAGEHYTCGLIVAKMMESCHYVDVDKELLSTLFSNRAACCLKMDIYKQAVEDCDFAINLNRNNIKAYYRKSMALKNTKNYKEAFKTAEEGMNRARNVQKLSEAKDLEDLIKEISSHLTTTPGAPTSAGGDAGNKVNTTQAKVEDSKSKSKEPEKVKAAKSQKAKSETKTSVTVNEKLVDKGSSKKETNGTVTSTTQSSSTKQKAKSATSAPVSVSVKDASNTQDKDVDTEWLQGTAASNSKAKTQTTPKQNNSSGKKKKKKKGKGGSTPTPAAVPIAQPATPVAKPVIEKPKPVTITTPTTKTSYSGKYSSIQAGGESGSSDEHFSLDEDASDDNRNELSETEDSGLNSENTIQDSWGSQVPTPQSSQDTGLGTNSKGLISDMGLDDFGYGGYTGYGGAGSLDSFPSLHPTYGYQQPKTSQPDNFQNKANGNNAYIYNKPDNREIGEWQKLKSKQSLMKVQSPAKLQKEPLTDFPVFEPPDQLGYPFDTRYDFTLACGRCYQKIADGPKGYKPNPGLVHECDCSVMLIKYKDKPDKKQWIKIRPRPNAAFTGKYMLCKTFPNGKSCKVGEYKCTFAHYQEEVHMWTLDRDGYLNIQEFIDNYREITLNGQMRKVLNGKVIEESIDPRQNISATQTGKVVPMPLMEIDVKSPVAIDAYQQQSSSIPGASFTQQTNTQLEPVQPSRVFTNSTYQASNSINPYPFAQQPQKPPGFPLEDPSQGFKRGLLGDSPADFAVMQQQQLQQQHMMYGQVNVHVDDQEVNKEVFPLRDTHNFRIVCATCLQRTTIHGVYIITAHQHDCNQDVLAVQMKTDRSWFKIRERKNHRDFDGKYVLCRYFCAIPPRMCMTDEDLCSFAHNRIEQLLWGLEKDKQFNLQEFILQNRTGGLQAKLFTVRELCRRHVGDFVFLCKMCFFGHPPRITCQHKIRPASCAVGHSWEPNKHMVFLRKDPSRNQTVIRSIEPRPFTHKTAFFLLCNKGEYCLRKATAKCVFAHSPIERDVWLVERDAGLTREQIVQQYYEIRNPPPLTISMSRGDSSGRSTPSSQTSVPVVQAKQNTSGGKGAEKSTCPFQIVEVCGVCWKQGQKCTQDKKRDDRCTGKGMGHTWSIQKMCVLLTKTKTLKEIRTMPSTQNMAKGVSFMLCVKIQEKKKCPYQDRCTFAHSMEEMEVWNWMVANTVKTYPELAEICRKENEEVRQAQAIGKGQSVVSATPTPPGAYKPPMGYNLLDLVSSSAWFCLYCSVQCNSQKQWDGHCASEQHMFNVNSDREHQWNFRQPSWGVHAGKYLLCEAHQKGKCRYSNVPDMHNLCKNAHSQAELDEWKERWEWRQMKKEIAKKDKVYSYMEELMEDYEEAESGVTVLKEEVDGAMVTCRDQLNIFKQDKKSSFEWVFKVQSQQRLQKVALLLTEDRLHFSLKTSDSEAGSQIAPGECFVADTLVTGLDNVYQVPVQFTGGLFGSFTQWVVFDFGSRPVLLRKLNVELGTQFVQDKVKTLREKLAFDRWTGHNRQIIKFNMAASSVESLDNQLLKHYKVPSSADAVVTAESVGVELNRHNYVHKMHKLLMIEELARSQVIAKYNLTTEIELIKNIHEGSLIIAKAGELFAKVPLTDQLSEDTDAGKLILTSVQSVLLAPQQAESTHVFEAVIVNKEMFDYDGKGRDYIYLCLSPRCVEYLNLEAGESLPVEIQFQMDRLPFCKMHYAVDQLKNNDIVFPDISKISPDWHEKQSLRLSSTVLNDDQMQIVRHIVMEHEGYTPPLIIYGPFGTGKTETIAQATLVLTKSNRLNAKILICTHSNSAADLYITKHFDAYINNTAPHLKMLRIYFQERRVNTVSGIVQKYCIKDNNSFRMPTRMEVAECHIVITTLNTSLVLTKLQLEGHFSHIFIDEAAQAMECETIMPLSLATETSCVVMAGDHMQIGPKVYSAEAKKQRLDKSLLERIFRFYEAYEYHLDKNRPLKILLKQNYRSKMEILRFISAISYGGPEKLMCKSDQLDVVGVVPLTFYVAQGKEIQEADSTSYYNTSEVEEVVSRVEELYDNWPESEWGERRPECIGVVTPYTDQVNRIRNQLRSKRNELRSVVVERIMNMQGKEFRAVFISTVRTRHLAEQPPKAPKFATECDGDFGDFGFLSDQKLLNTALTRAQSFVAVVGDPIALCAIGDCLNVWRAYLKHCNNMKSIYPSDYTMNNVRSQVVQLIHSPLGPNIALINSMTQEVDDNFLPKDQIRAPQPLVQPEPLPFNFASVVKDEKVSGSRFGAIGAPIPPQNQAQQQATSQALKTGLNNLSLEELQASGIESEVLLKQLCVDAVKKRGGSPAMSVSDIDFRWLEIEEEDGHALIKYDEQDNDGLEGDDDSDLDTFGDDLGGLLTKKTATIDYSPGQLRDLLQRNPFRYKRCLLHIEEENFYAKTLDPASQVDRIIIPSRQRCGRGINGDEVVVEILHDKNQTSVAVAGHSYEPQGQVLGVIERGIDPMDKMFVCTVQPQTTGILEPLNSGMPPIYNLETKARAQRARKGYVTVYDVTMDEEIVFSHHESVDELSPKKKLFVVRLIKWDSIFHAPLGVVVGILPEGTDESTGLRILRTEYSVPTSAFSAEAVKDLGKDFPMGYKLPEGTVRKRLDMRRKTVFTIGPDSKELNYAFSLDMIPNEQLLLGVHIADVTYFLKRDSVVDSETSDRAVSFDVYEDGPNTPKVMSVLPDRLSRDLCSLLPMKERLALSLFFTIDPIGSLLKMTPKKTVIKSECHLTLEDVQSVLKHGEGGRRMELSTQMQVALVGLNRITQMWRRDRLGVDNLYPTPNHSQSTFDAEILVEEVLTFVNKNLASYLLQSQASLTTPLLVQTQPSQVDMQEWRAAFAKFAQSSVGLARHYLPPGQTCSCDGVCSCIQPPDSNYAKSLVVSTDKWKVIREAFVNGNFDTVESAVLDMDSKPQILIAWSHLDQILRKPQFVCSGEVQDRGHYEFNLDFFTSITSPLSSYIDIVMHRIFMAATRGQNCPYTPQDIGQMCAQINDGSRRARLMSEKSQALQLALHMKNHPVNMYAIIKAIKSDTLHIMFSRKLNAVLPTDLNVDVISQPNSKQSNVTGLMQELVLEMPVALHSIDIRGIPDEVWPTFVSVPSAQWLKLLGAVKEGDHNAVLEAAIHANEALTDLSDQRTSIVQTEPDKTKVVLKPGNVAKVQLCADVVNGVLQPTIQLFSPAPKFVLCAEHKSDPVKCYVNVLPTLKASQQSYADVATYEKKWLPLIQLEAAEAISSNIKPIVVNNVVLTWKKVMSDSGMVYQAVLKLPVEFCHKKHLTFALDQYTLDMFNMFAGNNYNTYFTSSEEESSFVCVRHPFIPSMVAVPEVLTDTVLASTSNDIKAMYTWVGHCLVEKTMVHAGIVELTMKLVHSSIQMPPVLLEVPMPATIEVLLKPQVIRTYQKALKAMKDASPLCQDIILGQTTKPLDPTYLSWLENVEKSPLPGNQLVLDQLQLSALHHSVTSSFSVVQGVAGSGKTVILARLAYIFIQVNRMVFEVNLKLKGQCAKPVVMICAPTEQCLDIIEGYLLQYGNVKVSRPVFTTFYDPSQYQESDVIMCVSNKALEMRKLGDKYLNITQLIIDQANMICEPEMTIPLAYYTPYQVSLFGDDKQKKPPVVNSRAKKLGLDVSLFSRYAHKAVKLTRQYRMHETISEFPAQYLYKTVMEPGREDQKKASMLKFWPQNRDKPIAFVQVEGTVQFEDVKNKEGTKYNPEEMTQVIKVATNLVRRYHANPQEVAVISQHPVHNDKIQQSLTSKGEYHIAVRTVSQAQGCEWDYVIVSCVSSLPASKIEDHPSQSWIKHHLADISLPGEMCVALTRAKKGIIIIGNRRLLQFDKTWKDLLHHYDLNGKYVDASVFMPTK